MTTQVLVCALFGCVLFSTAYAGLFDNLLTDFTEVDHHFIKCGGIELTLGLTKRCCDSDLLPDDCQCFDVTPRSGFTNSATLLPRCPEDLGLTIYFYDRDHKTDDEIISAKKSVIEASPFDAKRRTVVITHGFSGHAPSVFTNDLRDELLDKEDYNIIAVNWKDSAAAPNYFRAVANTRSVAAMIAKLIEDLHEYADAKYEDFHLVGHSLGAQIMGYVGKDIRRVSSGSKIGRITGLDPAGPRFEKFPDYVHLCKDDADFVDNIHTDAEGIQSVGFGTRTSIGHVDFWVNGGAHQPACPKVAESSFTEILESGAINSLACSHNLAKDYFINSVSRCRFDTGDENCPMGYNAKSTCRGNFFPNTTTDAATYYCPKGELLE